MSRFTVHCMLGPFQPSHLKEISDSDLFVQLCNSTEDDILYTEFVNRFLPDIQAECLRICANRKIDTHVGQQIAHETFEKARKYKSFRANSVKSKDARKGILVYLYSISVNLFNDYYNKEKKLREWIPNHSYLDDIFEATSFESDVPALKNKKEMALKIFSSLNPKEQKVILKDLEYKRFQKYLPDDVNQTLSDELGVKKSTIRKIRERAITKIKTAIHEINKGQ